MKYKVFGKREPEPEVNMSIQLSFDGDKVTAVAVDDYGTKMPSGNLVSLTEDGRVLLHASINPSLGFKLTGNGTIRTASSK